MSYNKHNLKKARHNAALQGYAYFLLKREIAHVEVCHNMLTNQNVIGSITCIISKKWYNLKYWELL